jgi:hypothetical protein
MWIGRSKKTFHGAIPGRLIIREVIYVNRGIYLLLTLVIIFTY